MVRATFLDPANLRMLLSEVEGLVDVGDSTQLGSDRASGGGHRHIVSLLIATLFNPQPAMRFQDAGPF